MKYFCIEQKKPGLQYKNIEKDSVYLLGET